MTKPFLKWVGGKGRLLSQLLPFFPTNFNRYHEPFLGGGAVFFHLSPKSASISDSNPELINTYQCVRDNLDLLITILQEHKSKHCTEYYLQIRSSVFDNPVKRAARFIYLNKTCFNGLYRVNKSGQFNVPMGDYKKPLICDEATLRSASELLQRADISCEVSNYIAVKDRAQPGDFIYFDPPYHPISKTSNFTSYTFSAFTLEDQVDLRHLFADLSNKGIKAALSNSCCDVIKELYQEFCIHEINAPRSINCKGSKRGEVKEVLITNYPVINFSEDWA